MSNNLETLHQHGVSVWLDDLSRELTDGGELQRLVDAGVLGVTSNPTIFATALSKGDRYTDQVKELVGKGVDTEEAVFHITTEDVRRACDVLKPVFDRTDGIDGRVSLEVDPRQARDTAATEASARRLWEAVGRENLHIKIPATVEGLPAITTALSEGISVNVTLIFSLDRYRAVMQAFLTGLEQAKQNGHDISRIHSVASFFVSRVDTEVDRRLGEIGTDEANALRSKAGLANARLAYQAYEEVFSTPRWQVLKEAGAHAQRPLWASTGVKDPNLPDTLYVTGLVAENTVNTMPGKTLDATIDHGEVTGDTIRGSYGESQSVLDDLERLGISYTEVVELLETEGLDKFEKSWTELLQTVTDELERVKTQVEAQ
ncbi:transaldolase [Kineococcus radiotolerans]|uniref:Transaldolase n=1 Tax=Kineococcus radiotolerans TaxID=131568 RepID=A0A7W4TPX4_KINRA|nr:transaldolase [Kineococcus radiotolerans]